MLFFKVIEEDGERLECCPRGGNNSDEASCGELALGHNTSSSSGASSRSSSSDDDNDELPHCCALI